MLAYLQSSFRNSHSQEPTTVPNVSANSFANISPRNITEEQVLQLMDSNVNPFNGEAYSAAYQALLHTRKALPVYNELSSFLEMFQTQQIMLLMGETGSGKSTQIPQFVTYSDMPHLTGKMVAVTQPRKIAATSISERVAKEMDVTHGEEVGYAVRFEENWKDGTTFLKYMTDGLLLHEAMHDRDLIKYSTIILDEAQERSHSTDILMSLLKDIVCRRTDLKVIIMSAVDNPRFREYFGIHQNNLLSIPGRTYPVEEIYADSDPEKFVDAAIDKVCSIHRTEDPGDILVFLTGAKEIDDACQRIETQLTRQSLLDPGRVGPVSCVRLFAALPVEEQEKVFHDPPESLTPGGAPGRKIIVSTNIAEASLTIDGVVYVVDSGHEKSEMFDPTTGIETLKDRMISKASAQQRAGRAGRTKPGKCFRMYTRERFWALDDHTYPQILRCNLDTIVLMLIKLGIKDILRFDFIERPNPRSVRHALDLLISLGAIDKHSHEITEHGSIMADFPLKPQMSKALVSSVEYNCTNDIVTIAAMTYAGTVWFRPMKLAKEADTAKARFASPQGDHMTLLNVYHQYTQNKADEKWAWENYLSRYVLTTAEDIRIQLKQLMVQHSLPLVKSPHAMDDPSRHRDIGKALLCGFFGQVAQRNVGKKGFKTTSGEEVLLHASCLLLRSNPNATWVMYDKILHTTGRFMLTVSVIDRQWLLALRGPRPVAHSFSEPESRTQHISRPKNMGRRHADHRKAKKV